MKRFTKGGVILSLILTAVLVVSGCTSVASNVSEEAGELCDTYKDLREPIVIARGGAIQYWDQFSPEQREALLKIDEKLLALDKYGKMACAVAEGTGERSVDWNAVKATMYDALKLVVELQSKGIIKKL